MKESPQDFNTLYQEYHDQLLRIETVQNKRLRMNSSELNQNEQQRASYNIEKMVRTDLKYYLIWYCFLGHPQGVYQYSK